MTKAERQKLELQQLEFQAADRLKKAISAHSATPIVDDDYPEVRHEYESALYAFIQAMKNNARFCEGNRYGLREAR